MCLFTPIIRYTFTGLHTTYCPSIPGGSWQRWWWFRVSHNKRKKETRKLPTIESIHQWTLSRSSLRFYSPPCSIAASHSWSISLSSSLKRCSGRKGDFTMGWWPELFFSDAKEHRHQARWSRLFCAAMVVSLISSSLSLSVAGDIHRVAHSNLVTMASSRWWFSVVRGERNSRNRQCSGGRWCYCSTGGREGALGFRFCGWTSIEKKVV